VYANGFRRGKPDSAGLNLLSTMKKFLLIFVVLALPLAAQEQASSIKAGYAYLESGKYSEALKEFKEANKAEHNQCAECFTGISMVYARSGQFAESQENAQKALKFSRNDQQKAQAHNLLGEIVLELAPNDSSHWKQAEDELRAAISLDPKSPGPHLNLGVSLLRQSRDQEGIEELNKYVSAAPTGPGTDYARKLIENPKRARGAYAPDFQVVTQTGDSLSSQSLAGKIVVLDFWATWCPPCRASLPELKELTKKYSSSNVVLLSLSADDNEIAWRDFISKKQMNWPQYWDKDHHMAEMFGVHSYPTYILIDPEGLIRQRISGLNPQQSVAYRLKAELETLVKSTQMR